MPLIHHVRTLALAIGYTVPMLILFAPAQVPARFLPSSIAEHRNITDFVICVLCLVLVWSVQAYAPVLLPASSLELGGASIVALPVGELWDATSHFADRAILGRGGFGIVYGTRGRLSSLSREGRCAVKRLHNANGSAIRGLHNEIQLLGRCRHENLLPLLGYCLDRRAICLVYPLMAGGNLDDRLRCTAEARKRLSLLHPLGVLPLGANGALTWRERLRILRDATRALVYLHTPAGGKGVVLHRDVKPTNILLDEQLNAKLSDVELATEAPELLAGQTHVSSTSLVGTAGFLDPLYANTGQYSQLTDGFAMGVTLLVVLTGRPALEAMESCEGALEDPSLAPTCVDPTAGVWPEGTSRGLVQLVIGLSWRRHARLRMSLSDALQQLEAMADAADARPGFAAAVPTTAGVAGGAPSTVERECVVCMASPRGVRYRCGHCVCCEPCTELLERCPSCRVGPIRVIARSSSLALEDTFVHIASA